MPTPPNKRPEMGMRYEPLSSRSYGCINTGVCDMNAHRNTCEPDVEVPCIFYATPYVLRARNRAALWLDCSNNCEDPGDV